MEREVVAEGDCPVVVGAETEAECLCHSEAMWTEEVWSTRTLPAAAPPVVGSGVAAARGELVCVSFPFAMQTRSERIAFDWWPDTVDSTE